MFVTVSQFYPRARQITLKRSLLQELRVGLGLVTNDWTRMEMSNNDKHNTAVYFTCVKSFILQNLNCRRSFVRKDNFYRFVNSKVMETR